MCASKFVNTFLKVRKYDKQKADMVIFRITLENLNLWEAFSQISKT